MFHIKYQIAAGVYEYGHAIAQADSPGRYRVILLGGSEFSDIAMGDGIGEIALV